MIKNYFLIAVRSLLKQRVYTIIKIAGLALGLAASLIIFLYVQEDISYDRFNSNYDRIVRILTIDKGEGVSSKLVGVTPPPLGPAIDAELPEVIASARIFNQGRYDLMYEDRSLKCDAAYYAESSLFKVFDFKVEDGDRNTILDKPNSIAITRSLAHRIFGDENPIGKTVRLNQQVDLFVTAVLADPPKNSHIQFDLLRSITPPDGTAGFGRFLENWQGISVNTYLLLGSKPDETDLNSKIQAISKKNNAIDFFIPVVQQLRNIHLHSKEILFETNANKSDILNVYVLSTIALLILLLAVVNFVNLVTASAASRAREVGVRKVIGAMRPQLIFQHLTESVVVTAFAAVLGIALAAILVPTLNTVYQRFADFQGLLTAQNLVLMTLLVTGIGILAGLYPAFILSGFKPVTVLRGAFKNSGGGTTLRKALVIVQFTISIALMVGTGVVYQQMQFIYSADLGYNRDQVITIQQNGGVLAHAATFRNELLRNPSVIGIGSTSTRLGQQLGRTQIFPEGVGSQTNIITSILAIDETFIPTMDMKIVSGRNFSLQFKDSLSMVINEEMARLLKWADPVGRKVGLQSGATVQDQTMYTVVGVIKDFHFATIRHKLEPMFMLYSPDNGSMAIRIRAENPKATIAFIEKTWKEVNAGATFEYNFLDEQFANLYRNEQAFATMFSHFTILAMVIAGLGLFALSSFTAEQRRKEIGVRKVMGAGNGSILLLLSKEFMVLILIAFVFASGIAWFAMRQWLSDFSYSIQIGAGVFIAAGLLSASIALISVSFQALKAAVAKPVDSLRAE